jgi:NTP pyrophosphatase (non-canonical NTP hydrolase)
MQSFEPHHQRFVALIGGRAPRQSQEAKMLVSDLQARAVQIQQLYFRLNEQVHGRRWTNEETMLGFVGDVGDLAKLVMPQEGVRAVPGGRAALGHELADCLWSVLVLAHAYDIDLPAEFERDMGELEVAITTRLQAGTPDDER